TDAATNENYTKLYVFQESEGPKATTGPYRFGRNGHLFHNLTRIRLFAEDLLPQIRGGTVRWLRPPDPTGSDRFLAWTVEGTAGSVVGAGTAGGAAADPGEARSAGALLFVANTDTENAVENFNVPWPGVPGEASERSPTGSRASRAGAPGPEAALIFSTHAEGAAGAPDGTGSPGAPGERAVGGANVASGAAGTELVFTGTSGGERTAALPTKGGIKILRLEAGECRVYRVEA
ncbi:MAG: hypothetical protein ACLFO1_10645, partial [Spirochaetaceae bacterium]